LGALEFGDPRTGPKDEPLLFAFPTLDESGMLPLVCLCSSIGFGTWTANTLMQRL